MLEKPPPISKLNGPSAHRRPAKLAISARSTTASRAIQPPYHSARPGGVQVGKPCFADNQPMQLAALAQYPFRVRTMCLCQLKMSPGRWPSQGLGIHWVGALVNVVDMPYMQCVPNVPTTAVELARPDLDQTKAAMVVESTPVTGSG
jgi:hypothetical protein